ncbi:hypothetical protein Tco_1257041 [Tanacetum coccineum]
MYHFQATHLEVVLLYLMLLIYEVTLLDHYSAATQFGGVTYWYLEPSSHVFIHSHLHIYIFRFRLTTMGFPFDGSIRDYVPGPEYPKYVAPADDEILIKDRPLPTDALPTALSPSYVADFDPSDEDLEEDPVDYTADRGDDDEEKEESSEDDDDEEEEEEEAFEEEEEEEHLALADYNSLPVINPKTVRLQPPMAASTEALIVEFASASTPPSPPPSPLSLLSSPLPRISSPPLHTSPTYADAPLGYRAAMI